MEDVIGKRNVNRRKRTSVKWIRSTAWSRRLLVGQDAKVLVLCVPPMKSSVVISPSIRAEAVSVNRENFLAPGLTQRTVMELSVMLIPALGRFRFSYARGRDI